jgi:hypothetical protein
MTALSRTNLFRIPVLAVLPLALVGCPDDESVDDDTAGTDTGPGTDTGSNPGLDTGGTTDDDASGGDDDASGGDDDASGGDDDGGTVEPDSGEPVTPGDLAGFLEDTAASNAVYCGKAVECGIYDDAAACVAAREAEAESYFSEFSQECLDALADFANCYNAGTLSCEDDPEYGPYVGSDADCEEQYATSSGICFGGE